MTRPAVAALAVCALFASAAFAADLAKIQDQSTVTLVTKGRKSGLERRVTIWFVREGESIYVQSGKEGKTDWYRNLRGNPDVKLEFEGLTVGGSAHAVDDAKETERVHQLFREKYLRARVMGWFGSEVGRGKVVKVEVN